MIQLPYGEIGNSPGFLTTILSAVAVGITGAYKAYRVLKGDTRDDDALKAYNIGKTRDPALLPKGYTPDPEPLVTLWTRGPDKDGHLQWCMSINGTPAIPQTVVRYDNVAVSAATSGMFYFSPSVNSGIEVMTKSPFADTPKNDPHGAKAYDESIKPKPKSPFGSSGGSVGSFASTPTVRVETVPEDIQIAEYKEIDTARQVAVLNKNGGIKPLSPLANSKAVIVPGVNISREMIDLVGQDVSSRVGATTTKIIKNTMVDRFGDLGSVLTLVTQESENLNPDTFFRGVMGFFRKQLGDVRALIVERLEKAEGVFASLKGNLKDKIREMDTWVKDLDSMYAENIEHEKAISATIKQLRSWKHLVEAANNAFPAIDPNDDDAMLRAQEKRELEVKLNRINQKLDSFEKLKLLAQSNAPKIIAQQTSAENIGTALRETIDQTIPMIERAFAEYLADLDIQKAGNLVATTRGLGDAALRKSADATHKSATQSAELANQSIIKKDTLKYIQDKMRETARDVRQIEQNANTRREAEAIELRQVQAEYIQEIGQSVNAGQLASNRGTRG